MARSRFFKLRVSILLAVLFVVLLYAVASVRSRRARNDWSRPLNRMPALEAALEGELHRYRSAPARPFELVVKGPVDQHAPFPHAASTDALDLAKHAWGLWRWTARVDQAAGLDGSAYDARVYVIVRPSNDEALRFVEGESEQGGRIASLDVDLAPSMVDFAAFVTTHELLHTLGALDKYDALGHTAIPGGLAEPDKSPLFPQSYAEVMARGRVIDATHEELPERLELLRVGPTTAKEIGWTQ